ncbi:nucleotide exchange factor GrpE [Psychromonas aquimarina]|uniref:nucleotide exchange factor GrpE n=1 Tax=Psychromonas aquimarina TaxID=444919 RepID=UPI000414571E|nr:nucleotide exchange factor GrpE [Psychromonas aquimarina]
MSTEQKVSPEEQVETAVEAEQVETAAEQVEAAAEQVETAEELNVLERLTKKLTETEEQLKEQKDLTIRAQAFAQNEIRKAGIDAENRRKSVLKGFSNALVPVVDHLEMAISHADKENETLKPMVEGVEMTLAELVKAIGQIGVVQIAPQIGDDLNPEKHQAMGMQVVEGVEPNKIVAVMQKGYELSGGQVIRPAMVMVSKAAE